MMVFCLDQSANTSVKSKETLEGKYIRNETKALAFPTEVKKKSCKTFPSRACYIETGPRDTNT